MSDSPTIDLDAIARPIDDDRPGGCDLRRDDYERFQSAKDARTEAMAREREIAKRAMFDEDDEEGGSVPPPDWSVVHQRCVEILTQHSKDLWASAWLIEAALRLDGFAGLRDALDATHTIVTEFWQHISPPPDDEEGHLGTVSQLTSLNGEEGPGVLIGPLQSCPLVPMIDSFTLANYREMSEGRPSELSAAELQAALGAISPETLRENGQAIHDSIERFKELVDALETRCGETEDGLPVAPPSSQIRGLLEDCQRAFDAVCRDRLDGDVDATDDPASTTSGAAAAGTGVAATGGAIHNREDAFKMLLKVAEFFRKTEPHSPVSYMLQQAVRFGRMDLPKLLAELIDDGDALRHFAERTGIELPKEEDEDD